MDCLFLTVTQPICSWLYHSLMFPETLVLQSRFYFELKYLIAGLQEKKLILPNDWYEEREAIPPSPIQLTKLIHMWEKRDQFL